MEFLKLLADGVKYLVTLPPRLLSMIGRWRMFRYLTQRSMTSVTGELKPLSGVAKFLRGLGLAIVGLLTLAAIFGTLFGLWYLNNKFDLERQLAGPIPLLRKVWLPLLFLLFCGLCATGLWLWRLFGPEREPTDYPDILEAWREGRAALQEAGVRLGEVPLFLVLGRPAAGVDTLFGAARLPFPVRQVPRRGDAPLHIYANGHAIYVVCPGVSLVSRLAQLFAGEASIDADLPRSFAQSVFEEEPKEPSPAEPEGEEDVIEPLLLGGESSAMATLLAAPETETAVRPRPRLLKRTEEVARAHDRMNYLGRLIAFHRRPFCGINGILLLLPLAAGDNDEDASQLAGLATHDLEAFRTGLKTEAPIFAVICDLETAPGAAAFLDHFPEDRRVRLLGQTFPLVPDVPPAQIPEVIEGGVAWVSEALERLLLRQLQVETGNAGGASQSLRENSALFQLFAAIRSRLRRFGRVLGRMAQGEKGARMLGGCFLSATGGDPARNQAFVAGLFRLLMDHQNCVRWTLEARTEEEDFRRWTMFGYLGIGALLLAMGAMAYWQIGW